MLKLSHLKRSAVISAVVGTILTVTNQYEAVMGDQAMNLLKALITYATPFCVSLMSALLEKKRLMQDILVTRESSYAPLESMKGDVAAINLLASQMHRTEIDVNTASKNCLRFFQESPQLSDLNTSQIANVIEGTEAAVAGSAKNIGACAELLNLSARMNDEIERLLARG